MNLSTIVYRVQSWLKHRLTAWNTGGEGVHSPYLFEWIRMVMYDNHRYYVWDEIEGLRDVLLRDNRVLHFLDYGTGSTIHGTESERLVSEVARGSLEPAKYGQLLYRLVNWLGHQKRKSEGNGLRILELGTSLGITTAYLASVDSRDFVLTLEGCASVAEVAQLNWQTLGLKNVKCKVGNIDDTLYIHACGKNEVWDVVFMDANHRCDATCQYFEMLLKTIHEKSVIVVDDIHCSEDMETAWRMICEHESVSTTMDLYKMGLVFFDPRYLRRNYVLRV